MSETIGTTCVQGGYRPGDGEPRQIPIYQSTTWKFDTSEHMGRLFDLEESGYFYTRLAEPHERRRGREDRRARRAARRACSRRSGQAANFFAVFNLAGAGDHVVASSALYGGTYNLLAHTMRRMGLECTFVAPDCTDAAARGRVPSQHEGRVRRNRREPCRSPCSTSSVSPRRRMRMACRSSWTTRFPRRCCCRPIEWGADIVTHSTTKYMDGHGASVGGAIVDAGRFDWMAHARAGFPASPSRTRRYHGVVYAEQLRPGRRLHHEGDGPAHAGLRTPYRVAAERLLAEPGAGKPASCACRGTARTAWPWRVSCRSTRQVRLVRYPGLEGDARLRPRAEVPAERHVAAS